MAATSACYSACGIAWAACYAAAGLVAGTITAGVAAPAAAITCNSAESACMTACAPMVAVDSAISFGAIASVALPAALVLAPIAIGAYYCTRGGGGGGYSSVGFSRRDLKYLID